MIGFIKRKYISSIPVAIGLILLGLAASLLYVNLELDANEVAKYAFYSLTIGMIVKTIEKAMGNRIRPGQVKS